MSDITPTPSPYRDTFDARLAYVQSTHRPGSYQAQAGSSSLPELRNEPSASSAPLLQPPPGHPGCVLCSLVASTSTRRGSRTVSPGHSPSVTNTLLPRPASADPYSQPFEAGPSSPITSASSSGKEVVFQDSELTIYKAEGKEKLCSGGKHLIVVINKHVESVYELGPSDVPLLSHILDTCRRILLPTGHDAGPVHATSSDPERGKRRVDEDDLRVGFVGSVMKDPQCPHKHLHAHAMLGPIDTSLPGATFFRRNVVFAGVNWWNVEDLRAEIREESSNNRVKSGYEHRGRAPIDRVPEAGSVTGLPNALEPRSYRDETPPVSATLRSGSTELPHTGLATGKGKEPARASDEERRQSEGGEETYEAVELDEQVPPQPDQRPDRGGRI
ncbi:hypothetical protein IAU60_004019 [Kwoniella sp. DSM 27419]